MFGIICGMIMVCWSISCSYAIEKQSSLQMEYLLEKPTWGMIEWNSATLPKGYFYANFEFLYLYNGSFFEEGKEVDYRGERLNQLCVGGQASLRTFA